MPQLVTMQAIKRNYATYVGGHWFDPSTMRFFGTRLAEYGMRSEDQTRYYFVSSERQPGSRYSIAYGGHMPHAREYSVRVLDIKAGTIDTVGEFQQYPTRGTAHRAMLKAVK